MNPIMKRFLKMQILVLFAAFVLAYLSSSVLGAVGSATGLNAEFAAGDLGGVAMGAGLAIGLAGLGAGVGMGTASSAIVGAISEKPEMFGRSFIFVILIEAIAIYGLVISFILIGKLP